MSQFHLALLIVSISTLYVVSGSPECIEYAAKKQECFCETGETTYNSWSINCIDDRYHIKYVPRVEVQVECYDSSSSPLVASLFKNLNVTNVDHFKFILCPLPNVSYSQIMEGMKVRNLKIELPSETEIPSDLFDGLDNLERLHFINSHIRELPVDIFANLTRLKSLDLSGNQFGTLPEGLFENQKNLKQLQLSLNELKTLPSNVFANLTKLERLYLYKNKFTEIPEGLFDNLTSLTTIDLMNNEIKMLQPELFENVPALKDINLKGNSLESLPGNLFIYPKHLEEIDLSGNTNLKYLGEGIFSNIPNLTVVKMNDCLMTSVPDHLFSNCRNLTRVSLNNNKISRLDENFFFNSTKLIEIGLKYNSLSEIPVNLFKNQYKLEKLSLTSNNLRVLETGVFEYLTRLKELYLNENELESLNTSVMQALQSLEKLEVTKNKISKIVGPHPFGKSSRLKEINLSSNNLTNLGHVNWEFYVELHKIYLQNNAFKSISIPYFLSDRVEMRLENNMIRYVDTSGLDYVEDFRLKHNEDIRERVTFYLGGNELKCDCNQFEFYKYVTDGKNHLAVAADKEKLKCKTDEGSSPETFIRKDERTFVCPMDKNCSSTCKCDFRAVDRATVVQCLNLTELPTEMPFNTSEVYLQENYIASLEGLDDDMWMNVSILVLDNNNLTSAEWNWPPNLTKLSLQGNGIPWLAESTTAYVQNKDNQFQLYLGKNPWYCDCTTLAFKDFLQENSKKIGDLEAVICANEVYQNGSSYIPQVIKLSDELCPQENEVNNAYLITISVVCIVLAVLLFVVSVLYYRNKQMLTAYIYFHFHSIFLCFFTEEELDEDKTFDAFVSYSSADRDVALALMKELEESDPKLKLCIHERDWLPGNLITWNIANSVQNSRKTILVLSKNFLESLWFQIEFHTAYYQMLEDRIDRLIVIVKGDLPKKDSLDKDLQCLLSTKTYLEWGERWFWEKLRYALPHHHKSLPGTDKLALRQRPNSTLLKTVEDKIASLTITNDGFDKGDSKISNGGTKNGNAAYINSTLSIEDENKPKPNTMNNLTNAESFENAINLREIGQQPKAPTRPKRSPV